MADIEKRKIALIVEKKNQIKRALTLVKRLSLEDDILIGVYDFNLQNYFEAQDLTYSVLPEQYLSSQAINNIDHLAYQASDRWFLKNGQDLTVYKDISLGKILKLPAFFYFKKAMEEIETLLNFIAQFKPKEIYFFSDKNIFKEIRDKFYDDIEFHFLVSIPFKIREILKLIYYNCYFVYLSLYLKEFTKKIKSNQNKKFSAEILFFYDKGFQVLEPVRRMIADKEIMEFEIMTSGDSKIDNYLNKKGVAYSTLNNYINLWPITFIKHLLWVESFWKNNKQIIELSYRGIDFTKRNDGLRTFWKGNASFYLNYIEAAERYLEQKMNLKAIIFSQDVWPFSKIITLVANKKDIPTLVVQHGVTFDKEYYKVAYLPVSVDKIAVWGQESKNYFMQNGVAEERIEITGFPGFDKLFRPQFKFNRDEFCRHYQIDPNKKLILYATQNFSEEKRRRVFENIFQTIQSLSRIHLVVKLHPAPRETTQFYQSILKAKKWSDKNVIFLKDEDTLSLLNGCDLLITVHSTVHIEAAFLNKDIIIMNLDCDPELPIVKHKAALSVEKGDQLKGIIENVLYNKKTQLRLSNNREQFIKNYAYRNDGLSARRIVSLIKNL